MKMGRLLSNNDGDADYDVPFTAFRCTQEKEIIVIENCWLCCGF